jgi:O-antigen ligase
LSAPATEFYPARSTVPVAEALTRFTLGLFVFSGSFVLFEPSAYEVLFVPSMLLALLAGMVVRPAIMPLVFLMALFQLGGVMALPQVFNEPKTKMYVVISVFMGSNAIFYALVLSRFPLERFAWIKWGYILSAVCAACLGIIGYFGIAGLGEMLTLYGRAKGMFKDPNVFAPFLILPLILMLQDMLTGRSRNIVFLLPPFGIILIALLLAFSRAAWAHFLLSSLLTVGFLLFLSPSARLRMRVIVMSILGAATLGAGLVAILAIPSISRIFMMRLSLQSYDTGPGGRFTNQAQSLPMILDNPLGLGPFKFGQIFHVDTHNTYLNAFFSYGWLGWGSYVSLVLLTWLFGLYALMRPSPYQRPLGAIMATFIALSLMSFVIDTDHWRHYYLLLGCAWGFIAAVFAYEAENRRYVRPYLRTTA